ncbi:MAG: cytochrome C oxidase subunit IV family protein [Kyrpidia sp.]|nr:cytochrome C oxidase subunit IV family protein [Kyrpidia sp.]
MSNMPTESQHARGQTEPSHGAVRTHVISFAIMIVLTVVAFVMVGAGMAPWIVVPVILALAVIQVGLQLYDFMHLNQRGHSFPAFFITSGALLGLIFIVVLVLWP